MVWAISPLWPLLLLPLFVSFVRKAWDRHAKSASYQVWDSWLPSSSLKVVGEPRKAEMQRFKGILVSRGQPERHRCLKTLCNVQAKLHCAVNACKVSLAPRRLVAWDRAESKGSDLLFHCVQSQRQVSVLSQGKGN